MRSLCVTTIRWRCPVCRKTFTPPPPGMLPHKHYASKEMRERASRYIEEHALSYRGSAQESNMLIFHGDAAGSFPPSVGQILGKNKL